MVRVARSQKYSLGGSTNLRQNTADPCVGHVAACLSRAMAVLSQWELIQPISCHVFFFTRVAQEMNTFYNFCSADFRLALPHHLSVLNKADFFKIYERLTQSASKYSLNISHKETINSSKLCFISEFHLSFDSALSACAALDLETSMSHTQSAQREKHNRCFRVVGMNNTASLNLVFPTIFYFIFLDVFFLSF